MTSLSLYADTIRLQKEIAKKVITYDIFDNEIKHVCGIDVSYKKDIAYCSAAVIEKNTLKLVECVNVKNTVKQPYIPGLFMLRESKPIKSNFLYIDSFNASTLIFPSAEIGTNLSPIFD